MQWIKRTDKRKNDMAHGITFHMWERKTEHSRGEAAYKGKKLHLDGWVSITIAENQWKYGDEIIMQVFTKEDGKVLPRRADGYNRIQIYLGEADLNTAETFEWIAAQIRKIVNAKKDLNPEEESV